MCIRIPIYIDPLYMIEIEYIKCTTKKHIYIYSILFWVYEIRIKNATLAHRCERKNQRNQPNNRWFFFWLYSDPNVRDMVWDTRVGLMWWALFHCGVSRSASCIRNRKVAKCIYCARTPKLDARRDTTI